MAKKKKHILRLLLVAIVVTAVFVYINFNSIITRTAERIASDALGVKVKIGLIDISLTEKKVAVSSLEVANPPRYRTAYAMKADQIVIGLNGASKKLIDFSDIEVKGSVVNLEVNEQGNMNINDLKRLAARKEQKDSVGSEEVRVIVQHLVIDASVINPSITLLGRDIAPIRMPAIKFAGMGQGGGAPAGDVIAQVMGKYLAAIEKTAQENGALSGLPGGVGDVKKTLDDAAGGLQKMFR